MKRLLILTGLMLTTMMMPPTAQGKTTQGRTEQEAAQGETVQGRTEPYFGKDAKGTERAVQRCFKKTFKRPKGVNYDTSARIHVECVIDEHGQVVVPDPERVTLEATVYSTVVETENYRDVHGTKYGTHTAVMGSSQQKGERSESEILREAVLEWLPTMPAWTPGSIDGEPQQMEVSFDLTF